MSRFLKRYATVEGPQIKTRLGRVAWLSILLGLLMEALLIIVRLGNLQTLELLLSDVAQGISWAFLVCMGLAIGRVVSKGNPLWGGLAGLISAPSAFLIARGVHEGATEFLAATAAAPGAASAATMALIRGVEYFCLGAAIIWLGERPWGGAIAHIAAGLIAGALFGGIVLALTPQAAASSISLASLAINELLFPIGCSLVLYSSAAVGRQVVGEAA